MKNILFTALLLLAGCALISCEKEVDLPIMTEQEPPRIFGNWPAKNPDTGALGILNAQQWIELVIEMQYTPAEFCTAIWYLDDVEYCRGPLFRYSPGIPVTHHLKLVVATPRHTTYREATLTVTPTN